jgi:hypothetical protein
LKGVVRIDKWLETVSFCTGDSRALSRQANGTHHKKGPDGVIQEDDGGGHEHGEAYEFVKLRISWVSCD